MHFTQCAPPLATKQLAGGQQLPPCLLVSSEGMEKADESSSIETAFFLTLSNLHPEAGVISYRSPKDTPLRTPRSEKFGAVEGDLLQTLCFGVRFAQKECYVESGAARLAVRQTLMAPRYHNGASITPLRSVVVVRS
mmetsp:Transcript_15213/g.24767  ORF Transcript_15213/g.24767 Transcript_15213/m.24767 type:complete len:137 (-) Transcript_15213:134-544(-)